MLRIKPHQICGICLCVILCLGPAFAHILAWESGLYDCREMNAALVSSMPLENAIARGIFGIWGRSEQVYPLFEYARSTTTTTRPWRPIGPSNLTL
jgi:hypothetical protein